MSKDQSVHGLRPGGGEGQTRSIRDTMTALMQEAHKQQKHAGGGRITPFAAPASHGRFAGGDSPMLPEKLQGLLRETNPTRRLSELVLPRRTVEDIWDLIREVRETALLRSHSLEPRHTLLLVGPPGTGKTTLSAALAAELALPFLTVRYEGLVGSYLGETASRLQDVVDYASRTPCVLFFDEFDSVGKERSDAHETGEIKRVVSSLLLHMDALPSHCIIVCATNHPELLDRAVWRRFELRIELPPPGAPELRDWFTRTESSFGELGMTVEQFVFLFKGETFSEIEAVTLDARRIFVLSNRSVAPRDAFKEAIARWERRRAVGGVLSSGTRSHSQNTPRAGKTAKKTGKESAISESDLLGHPGAKSGA